ncbi:MAG: HisA/HisF-related TIM barrel protein [Gemmataceae bacterium]
MRIYPAIDLRGGKCVRLRQGDYAQETVFGDDAAVALGRQRPRSSTSSISTAPREGRPVNGDSVRASRRGDRPALPARRRPPRGGALSRPPWAGA